MTGLAGRLIALEGGEGCGKSTQACLLADALGAVLTREPGGTEAGERIRALVLDPETGHLDPRTEALLVAAARAQHVAEFIRPALEAGRIVVTDRYIGSSLAYQGFGRGLDVGDLRRLNEWATSGLWPDLTILLEVPQAIAAARLGPDRDRLEAETGGFHDRVMAGFAELAATAQERWLVVDGAGPVEAVSARVLAAVEGVLSVP
ncbi:MAG: dTMP kinase [Acidimicrobiales bacterium]